MDFQIVELKSRWMAKRDLSPIHPIEAYCYFEESINF